MVAITVIFVVMLLIGNIYFLAHYAHPNDTNFGKSIPMRILVVRYCELFVKML